MTGCVTHKHGITMVTGNSAFGRHLCVIFKRKARILLKYLLCIRERRFFLNCSVNLVSHFRCQSQINCIWKILQPGCAKCFFKKENQSIKMLLFLLLGALYLSTSQRF